MVDVHRQLLRVVTTEQYGSISLRSEGRQMKLKVVAEHETDRAIAVDSNDEPYGLVTVEDRRIWKPVASWAAKHFADGHVELEYEFLV